MDTNAIPKLAPGCRLHPTEPLLLIPEGTLKLSGPSREILASLDGKTTIAALIGQLNTQYPDADPQIVQQDTLSLLERMIQRGVIRI